MSAPKTPRVKIVSDGTPPGTHITINGQPIQGVTFASWSISVGGMADVVLELNEVDVELEGDLA